MEKQYCAAPWRSLHIYTSGDVKTCCSGHSDMLGNLNDKSIDQILLNPVLKEIRSTIKSGRLHDTYCRTCINSERYNTSEREWHNNINQFFDCSTASLNDYKIVLADIRWSSLCNLSCNYCSSGASSAWARLQNIPINEETKKYYLDVVDFISKNLDTIREVALVGGEPLLMKENLALLDSIPKHVLITIITNLAVNFDKNKIVKKLLERPRVGWSMSFDNIGDRFEYVRYGNNWNTMNKNVSVVADKIKNHTHHGGIHAVYNLYNCTRLIELKEYAVSKNLTIQWQGLLGPSELNPTLHNINVRNLAIQEIKNLKNKFELDSSENNFMAGVLNVLESKITSDSDMTNKFLTFTEQIENVYHPDTKGGFARLWPELFMLI